MTWKGWLAVSGVLLAIFIVVTFINRQRWVAKDVELQMQIAALQVEADKHASRAEAAERRQRAALMAVEAAQSGLRKAEAKLDALRKRHRNRPTAETMEDLQLQLNDADVLISGLEDALVASDVVIVNLHNALAASDEKGRELASQVEANEEAWRIERKRSEKWQKQTRRAKVKTAFFGIGIAAASGLAGYGVGVTR